MNYKNKNFILGVATGITGLGLQNLNPNEPIAITHFNAILLGLIIFVIAYWLIPLIIWLISKYKEVVNDEL